MKRSITSSTLKHLKPKDAPYKLSDGGGLYLLVKPSGAKLWRYKYRLAGTEKSYSIGSFPETGLAEARKEHEYARKLVSQGLCPVAVRRHQKASQAAEGANSFKAVAEAWIEHKRKNWSETYARQVQVTLGRDVYPAIGGKPINQLAASDLRPIILSVASRIQPPDGRKARDRGATTVATLIRQWLSMIFRFAVAHGCADSDPAYALKDIIARPKVRHHQHLTAQELPELLVRLRARTGTRQVGIAIEMLLLTFVRTGELRRAEWSEFDIGKSIWRIPGAKMKMGKDHIVPLSTQVIALLEELRKYTGTSKYLFPSQRTPGAEMSMTTINRALERMGYGGRLSGHGFRGTASTCLNELGFESRVIEKQLAHDRRTQVEASYNHAEFLPERRKMLQLWSNTVLSKPTADATIEVEEFA